VSDDPQLQELRRRVQEDPASIAFARLAEELRKAGANDEAANVARAGLQHRPDYLSARVTLGRALMELDRLEEAQAELTKVLQAAPSNLAATRALAEVFQKRGQMPDALAQFRKALELTKSDPKLQEQPEVVEPVVAPPPAPFGAPPASAKAVATLFDFDGLIEKLGVRSEPRLNLDNLFAPAPLPVLPVAPKAVEPSTDAEDLFSVLERQLRAKKPEPSVAARLPEATAEERMLAELEGWLSAIRLDREQHLSA